MSASGFVVALVRLIVLALPVPLVARWARPRLTPIRGVEGAVVDVVIAVAVVVVVAELLGLDGAMRFGWLAVTLWLVAAASWLVVRSRPAVVSTVLDGDRRSAAPVGGGTGRPLDARVAQIVRWSVGLVLVVVIAQWLLATADSLGGGMFSFDVLWYHMPFAALFAQTGSVTHIQFTQADPYVAYYPATAELLNGLGIVALGNDFLSPLLNLGWLALALAAGWLVGRRWQVGGLTLAVVATLCSLSVLSTTQPGEAFNDIVGLAALLCAVALLSAPQRSWLRLTSVGVALGLAIGTKYTFVIPGVVFVLGIPFMESSRRVARMAVVASATVVTAGWWYLRATIHTGSPLGIRTRVGPLSLPGPVSALANAQQQTVLSQISHLSLWGSRFVPGLTHAFGVLWPVVLAAWLVILVITLAGSEEPFLKVLAVAAALAGLSYLVLPTGASAIQGSSELFTVNLRYAMPALALGLLLVPIVVSRHAPRQLVWVGPALVLVTIAAQLEPNLWPSATARHVAFLAVTAAVLGAVVVGRVRLRAATRLSAVLASGVLAVVIVVGAGYAVQRHYFNERYRVGDTANAGLGELYAWAQTVSDARIALYGTVEQYPLYGRTDSNRVTYLGRPVSDGGYAPIDSCRAWQQAINGGRYQYLVLTPGPTSTPPGAWTTQDADVKLILRPPGGIDVYEVTGTSPAVRCT